MKTFVFALSVVSFGFVPFANANALALKCSVETPCSHASSSDLGYCVRNVAVYGSSHSTNGQLVVTRSPSNPAQEIFLLPTELDVTIKKTRNTIEFRDEEGDNWGELSINDQGQFNGVVTLEEDFEFRITCQDDAIGYESFR